MHAYPAAERLALEVVIEGTVDDAVVEWRSSYARRVGALPSVVEERVARATIERRLAGEPPPLPPSASSSGWRMPALETWDPNREETKR